MTALSIYTGNHMHVMITTGWSECSGLGNKSFRWPHISLSVNSGAAGKSGLSDGGPGTSRDGAVGIYGQTALSDSGTLLRPR